MLTANGIGGVPSGGISVTASVVSRFWAWRTFLWAGVIGSVLGWAWAWSQIGGVSTLMVLWALAAVVLAIRGTSGIRLALAGLVVSGVAMFLASLYWVYKLLLLGSPNVSAAEVIALSVLPMVAAIVLLLGAASGFRHAKSA